MQEHGKVFADSLVALRFQFRRLCTHDAPVPFPVRDAE
jgi:hypothetical protein